MAVGRVSAGSYKRKSDVAVTLRMASNILLTGRPGVGKTTAIRRTIELLPELKVGGFVTAAIEKRGRRIGFSIRDLRGAAGVLASTELTSGPQVSRYRVNVQDIEKIGVPALLSALEEADLVVCDEIGRMELFCPEFCAAIQRCLDSSKPVFGTLQARPEPFLDAIRARSDVELIEVSTANRDVLPGKLAAKLRRLAMHRT